MVYFFGSPTRAICCNIFTAIILRDVTTVRLQLGEENVLRRTTVRWDQRTVLQANRAGAGWGWVRLGEAGWGGGRGETQAGAARLAGNLLPSSRRVEFTRGGKTHLIRGDVKRFVAMTQRWPDHADEGQHGGHGISCGGLFIRRGMLPIWGSVVNFETEDLNVFIGASMWFLRPFSKFFSLPQLLRTAILRSWISFSLKPINRCNFFQLWYMVLAFQELTMTSDRGINPTLQFSCSAHY